MIVRCGFVFCVIVSFAAAAMCADPNSLNYPADANNIVQDANGLAILLGYSKGSLIENPFPSFMYFVPLISPALVDNEISAGNKQRVRPVSLPC